MSRQQELIARLGGDGVPNDPMGEIGSLSCLSQSPLATTASRELLDEF